MHNHAVFNLGFRLFFLSATFLSVCTMTLWLFLFGLGFPLHLTALPPLYWHGHEMIFGYAMAVVAGFLLTAVQNWTGIAMPHGKSLLFIWLPWFSARLIYTLYPNAHILAECLDTLFLILLIHPIARAIFQVKQYRQMGILSKLCLLLIANLLYLSGSLNWLNQGHYLALQLGFFLILSLVLTIGRRILPFFIEKGVGYPVTLKNSALKDRLSLITFLLFFLTEIFTPWHTLASLLALSAALTQTWRLIGWHTQGIWKKPLLWSLYLGMVTIIIGLTLYFLRLFFPITNSLALHALAVGGIGIISLSMIGRVSLGHTGRNIHQPSKWLIFALYILFVAFFFRVLMPLILPQKYLVWIIHAQICWIIAFLALIKPYLHIWTTPRPDGKHG